MAVSADPIEIGQSPEAASSSPALGLSGMNSPSTPSRGLHRGLFFRSKDAHLGRPMNSCEPAVPLNCIMSQHLQPLHTHLSPSGGDVYACSDSVQHLSQAIGSCILNCKFATEPAAASNRTAFFSILPVQTELVHHLTCTAHHVSDLSRLACMFERGMISVALLTACGP